MNTKTTFYIAKVDLIFSTTNLNTEKIYSLALVIYKIITEVFSVENKLDIAQFLQESFCWQVSV